MRTRAEHIAWCKLRALEYVDAGNIQQAVASMCSDLDKHDKTSNHVGKQLGLMGLMGGSMNTPADTRKWIEGFN